MTSIIINSFNQKDSTTYEIIISKSGEYEFVTKFDVTLEETISQANLEKEYRTGLELVNRVKLNDQRLKFPGFTITSTTVIKQFKENFIKCLRSNVKILQSMQVEPIQPEIIQHKPIQPEPIQPEPIQQKPIQPKPVKPDVKNPFDKKYISSDKPVYKYVPYYTSVYLKDDYLEFVHTKSYSDSIPFSHYVYLGPNAMNILKHIISNYENEHASSNRLEIILTYSANKNDYKIPQITYCDTSNKCTSIIGSFETKVIVDYFRRIVAEHQ